VSETADLFGPDWADVVRRSRRHRARRVAWVAVTVAIVVAAPALAIAGGVIDFSSAPTVPAPVRVDFGKLDAIDPLSGPGAITGETRDVYTFKTSGGPYELMVAPARDGWCYGLAPEGRRPLDIACPRVGGPMDVGHSLSPPTAGPDLIEGSIHNCSVHRIVMTFEDGSTTDLPFVSVSAPIDADFFVYELTPAHEARGVRPSTVTAFDGSGAIVGSGWFLHEADAPTPSTGC
jgi:hypothetical protein